MIRFRRNATVVLRCGSRVPSDTGPQSGIAPNRRCQRNWADSAGGRVAAALEVAHRRDWYGAVSGSAGVLKFYDREAA